MKNELDSLMQQNDVDILLVVGPADHNPAMVYLTGGGHVTNADLVKKYGETPVLFAGAMERDEAAKTGLPTRSYSDYPLREFLKESNGDYALAYALRYKRMFQDLGISSGKLAIYGQVEVGPLFSIMQQLPQVLPDIQIKGFLQDPILLKAMMTKEDAEVERIRRMGKITTSVVGQTADFLTSHKVKDSLLVKSNGQPLTIGEVKGQINFWLAQQGAENPEGTIFAISRDAGVPHSSGNPTDFLRLGETIIFDIFPCEAGGGYFYDFTRTWCLGYAKEEAQKLYDDVYQVYNQLASELKVNTPFGVYQKRTCDLFEALGHPTIQSTPETNDGYVHSLGHGVGLRVHEMPFSGASASQQDSLFPGTIFTMEPGLYYPDRGLGVRLEDTYYTRPDGTFERLAEFPLDLILPIKS